MRRSLLIYLALMAYLALVKVVLDLASVEVAVASQATIFSWPVIGALTLAGGLSVWLGPRVGLPGLWETGIPARQRLLFPALVGLGLGAVALTLQVFTGFAQVLAAAANVPAFNVAFPASLLFYSGGAIILEGFYRLILITLPLWLIANAILRRRGRRQVFWALALLTSAHEPAMQMGLLAGHPGLMLVSGVAAYGLNVFEAHLLWRYGFLAPLVLRLAYYLVWHVAGSAAGF